RAPPLRLQLICFGVLALLGVVVVAAVREITMSSRTMTPPPSRRAVAAARPPFTRGEENYIQALWPIHGDVERSTVRMRLGQIFYKTSDFNRPQRKARVDEALATYRQAGQRLRALEPPPSLRPAHEKYLAAVGLFEQSALEVLKMFDDGRDDHLLTAYPLNQE